MDEVLTDSSDAGGDRPGFVTHRKTDARFSLSIASVLSVQMMEE